MNPLSNRAPKQCVASREFRLLLQFVRFSSSTSRAGIIVRYPSNLFALVVDYFFVNTFTDDLFAFIPSELLPRDEVLIVYLWQRHLYPVDSSPPVEGKHWRNKTHA